jgi:biotin-dependent carboxylase-like uncharacterized protein
MSGTSQNGQCSHNLRCVKMSDHVPVFRIIKPGIYCAFQDLGRFGYRHLGVPWSGAMDRLSYLQVNQKFGNHFSAPVLEIMGQGLSLEVLEDVWVYWTGADAAFALDDHSISNPIEPLLLEAGQKLTLIKQHQGNWTYLGIKSGFHIENIMGSASSMKGTHLSMLNRDDIVFQKSEHDEIISYNNLRPQELGDTFRLKAYPGPELDWLHPEQKHTLTSSSFVVTREFSRMGYRLNGQEIILKNGHECITSPLLPGSVQLLPNGQLIVLMRECQTTGGYPRVLQLDELSISILAQKRSGESFIFDLL